MPKPCKRILFLLLYSIQQFAFGQPPVINSFSPASGPIGITVTINGNNFSSVPANNIVYFGAVMATVLTATPVSLTVRVPNSADFRPITVTTTNNNLTAYSLKPFHITFPGGDNSLSANSFDDGQTFNTYTNPWRADVGDLDGDSKPDLVAISTPGGSASPISILRNNGTHGNISFEPRIEIIIASGQASVFLADLDGDGRLDMAANAFSKLILFRNTSSPGTISFASPLEITTATSTANVHIYDLDKDGKPDVLMFVEGALYVFKNNSTVGNIVVAAPVLLTPVTPTILEEKTAIEDLDGDTKPDIAYTDYIDDSVLILRNTSVPGNISFAPPFSFSTNMYSDPADICIGDIDGDNISDISIVNSGDDNFVAFKNSSSPGNFSFAMLGGVGNAFITNIIANGDLNGDGKLDIALHRQTFGTVALIRNNSRPCSFSFDPWIEVEGDRTRDINISDLNGDGKPEVILLKDAFSGFKIYKNKIGQTAVVCSNGTVSIPSSHTGAVYQWQENNGSGYNNISNNSNYSGTGTAQLTISNTPLAWNGYKYRCRVDTDTSNVFTLSVNASLTPTITLSRCPAIICSGNSTITLTATVSNHGASPMYQWQDSSNVSGWLNIAGATSSTLIYTPVINGTKVRCILSSSVPCASPATVTSSAMILNIFTTVVPSVSASGNTIVNQGQSTLLTATPTNGGPVPSYQWQDSINVSGWNNIPGATLTTLNYMPAQSGHRVRCRMTGSAICSSPTVVTSNTLIFTVNFPTAINPVPGSEYGIVYFPNPVDNELIIDSLKLSDKWQTLDLFNAEGKKMFSKAINGQLRIILQAGAFPAGSYIIVLRRQQGLPAYLKLIKR